MRGLIFALVVLGGMVANAANLTVKDVHARQRYPWNGKVDIDFTLESDIADAEISVSLRCFDEDRRMNIPMRSIARNDGSELAEKWAAGKHRLLWDAAKDMPNMALTNLSIYVDAFYSRKYLVIDISGGASATRYPVSYLDSVPEGGWSDEFKTTKILMRRCPKGEDPKGRYSLTRDFYAGVFEVTRKQWELVMGTIPISNAYTDEYVKGDKKPVINVSYDMIRGTEEGAKWPASAGVDAYSFIGKLREKTGLMTLDLPTEGQWEYACRAGTTTRFCYGYDQLNGYSKEGAWFYFGKIEYYEEFWLWQDVDCPGCIQEVGYWKPNAWGLYDVHGNVEEWCLDWWSESGLSGTDPKGAKSGTWRSCRGGSVDTTYHSWEVYSSSEDRSSRCTPSNYYGDIGFRLFRTVP